MNTKPHIYFSNGEWRVEYYRQMSKTRASLPFYNLATAISFAKYVR